MDSGKILPLASRSEFTLGRLSQGQPIMPDIDLTPYQAYASGVSRLHAVVKRDASRVLVMDLGSSNGTYINGRRINPHVEESLNHGDIVALGKLKIQVLLRNI
jgi:pSer/pThr/pTyr-binding forkhead associated (FHA) protein